MWFTRKLANHMRIPQFLFTLTGCSDVVRELSCERAMLRIGLSGRGAVNRCFLNGPESLGPSSPEIPPEKPGKSPKEVQKLWRTSRK